VAMLFRPESLLQLSGQSSLTQENMTLDEFYNQLRQIIRGRGQMTQKSIPCECLLILSKASAMMRKADRCALRYLVVVFEVEMCEVMKTRLDQENNLLFPKLFVDWLVCMYRLTPRKAFTLHFTTFFNEHDPSKRHKELLIAFNSLIVLCQPDDYLDDASQFSQPILSTLNHYKGVQFQLPKRADDFVNRAGLSLLKCLCLSNQSALTIFSSLNPNVVRGVNGSIEPDEVFSMMLEWIGEDENVNGLVLRGFGALFNDLMNVYRGVDMILLDRILSGLFNLLEIKKSQKQVLIDCLALFGQICSCLLTSFQTKGVIESFDMRVIEKMKTIGENLALQIGAIHPWECARWFSIFLDLANFLKFDIPNKDIYEEIHSISNQVEDLALLDDQVACCLTKLSDSS